MMRPRQIFVRGVSLFVPLFLLFLLYINITVTPGSGTHKKHFPRTGGTERGNKSVMPNQVVLKLSSSRSDTDTYKRIANKFQPQWWKNHTETVCQKLGMNTNQSQVPIDALAKILVDDKHKLLYCQIAKVASTYMGKIFAILAGLFNGTNPDLVPTSEIHYKYNSLQLHLNTLPAGKVLHKLKHYYKFVFVRDPFERLLSAFRNKFLKPPSNFFSHLSQKLAIIYRTNSTLKGGATFEEFIRYLVDPAKKVKTNAHWQPFHELCRPCDVKYDFVGKLTTFNEDTRYILEKNNLSKLIYFPKVADSSHSLHNTDLYLEKYYSQIPKQLLQELYNVYKPDYIIYQLAVPASISRLLKRK